MTEYKSPKREPYKPNIKLQPDEKILWKNLKKTNHLSATSELCTMIFFSGLFIGLALVFYFSPVAFWALIFLSISSILLFSSLSVYKLKIIKGLLHLFFYLFIFNEIK
ncbi:MAG: hypothetical protein ACOC44_14175 [Promethearchaeia archaeon]